MNPVLVPFSDDNHGEESVENVNSRWVHDILPYAHTSVDYLRPHGDVEILSNSHYGISK